jgi:peptidyl-prolyl cis-trans isomerase A (cyclophilin A)
MGPLISRRLFVAAAGLLSGSWAACGVRTTSPSAPHIVIYTVHGIIELVVNLDQAPLTAGNFLEYVDRRLFDEGQFYRSVAPDNDVNPVKISVIQGGVVDNAKVLPPIPHESTRQTGLRHLDGTVSAARGALGSGTAGAFFICIGDQPQLDFGGRRNPDGQGFAAFGRVVGGMDVVHEIWTQKTRGSDGSIGSQRLATPVAIATMRRK